LPGWPVGETSRMSELATRFLDLHRPGDPLLIPNPWDAGSAKLPASLGFEALATTSSGYAATLGRVDNSVTRSSRSRFGVARGAQPRLRAASYGCECPAVGLGADRLVGATPRDGMGRPPV